MKKRLFYGFLIAYGLLSIADGTFTYFHTPDLDMEGNPLVMNLGFGWPVLLAANILTFVFITCVAYYALMKYETIYANQTKFTEYYSQITFGRPDRFWSGMKPIRISPYVAALGIALVAGAVVDRIVVVLEWLFYTLGVNMDEYYEFKANYLFSRMDVFLALIAALVAMFLWFYLEFKKQVPKDTEDV